MIIDIAFFAAGVLVAYLIFRVQTRKGEESNAAITNSLVKEEHTTRTRIDLLERRISRILEESSVHTKTKRQVKEVFDTAVFEEIIQGIDLEGNLRKQDDASPKEFTKRLLFYVIGELFSFPYSKYVDFMVWLRTKGYHMPDHLIFSSKDLYERALLKVERLNRSGIGVGSVDANLLFSKKRPFSNRSFGLARIKRMKG